MLEIQRRVSGPEHPDTLTSMDNLANIYEDEGKYTQAETLHSQTLEIKRRVLGPEHPSTLESMMNLALTYQDEGRYAQAEALDSQTLQIKRRVLGPEHPDTLETLSALAAMYQRQGKYTLAETYVAQTLAGRRHALGSEHPDTMASVADLALAEVSEGRFAESEPLAREALDTNSKIQPGNWQRFRAESLLGASLAGEKKYTKLNQCCSKAIKGCWLERTLWPSPINTTSNWHGDGLSRSTKTGASLEEKMKFRKQPCRWPHCILPTSLRAGCHVHSWQIQAQVE
jgi:tetratricopeptide (TPR) repeat protein